MPPTWFVGMKNLMQPLWNSLQVPETRCGGAWPDSTFDSGGIGAPHGHSRTVYSSQDVETAKCPLTEEWMKKAWCVYTHTCTHTCAYIHVCARTYRVCTRVRVCTYMCARVYTHTHSEIPLSHEKKETMLLAAPCEDLEDHTK